MTPDERIEAAVADPFWLPPGVQSIVRPRHAFFSAPGIDRAMFNQVTISRLTPDTVDQAVADVLAHHQGRTTRWAITSASTPLDLADRLGQHGFSHQVSFRVAFRATHQPVPAPPLQVDRIHDRAGLLEALQVSETTFGFADRRPQALTHDLRMIQQGRIARFLVRIDGEPVCSGGLSLFPELSFGLLWAGGTVPDARGHGAYRALLEARRALAQAAGLDHVGLYAKTDTSLPIVTRLGFQTHGWMHQHVRAPHP